MPCAGKPRGTLQVSISGAFSDEKRPDDTRLKACLAMPSDLSNRSGGVVLLPGSRSPEAPCTPQHTGCGSSRWAPFPGTGQSTAGHR